MRLLNKVRNILRTATDRRYLYMYWQRRIADRAARARRARAIASRLPQADYGSTEEAGVFARDGYIPLPRLAADRVSAMRKHFELFPVTDPYRPHLGSFDPGGQAPTGTHVAYFEQPAVLAAPHALDIANDPQVLAVLSNAFGCRPLISYMQAWWSFPAGETAQEAENFHRDYDDFKFAKLFLYLTDVDGQSGPHAFVRGSQRSDELRQRVRYQEADVASAFPDTSSHLVLTGPAGTRFLEDTSGLHRGIPPLAAPRLIFQVLYSLRPYYGGPRRPLRSADDLECRKLDPYSNGVYLAF